jgi:drug/metabolite transporter (DMT)-like permease
MAERSTPIEAPSVGIAPAPVHGRTPHYAAAAIGALGISTAPVLVVLSDAGATPAAFWRFSYALPLLALSCLARGAGRRSLVTPGWIAAAALAGVFFACDIAMWHRSIGLIGAGPSTLLANTQVVWVALFGVLFLGERPTALFWLALPALGAGLWLLAGGGLEGIPAAADRTGLAYGLGAGIAYAGALICMRRSQRAAPVIPEATLLVQLAVGWPLLAGLGLAEGTLAAPLDGAQHAYLALLGVGVQVCAWTAIAFGIRRLPGHHGATLLLAQPVSSLVLAWWILGQALDAGRVVGCLLILAGILGALIAERRVAR